jgi:peptidoglycan/xylan/chitin deacetylase (PgdA/CDA1 family)
MVSNLYLTIDDSPSQNTDALTDFLKSNEIEAVLFSRGDRLQDNPEPIIRAAQKGFIIANHAFSHKRSSQMSLAEITSEIEKTEVLINEAYKKAGINRAHKYFRFPHMDRGCGGWVIDYDALADDHKEIVIKLFSEGLNVSLSPPHAEQIERKERLQEYLKLEGYQKLPSDNINYSWFQDSEVGQAADAMFTFSTSDWMITPRHIGKWAYKSLDDLKMKIDIDLMLNDGSSDDIVLLHDQEDMLDIGIELINHFLSKGHRFKKFS